MGEDADTAPKRVEEELKQGITEDAETDTAMATNDANDERREKNVCLDWIIIRNNKKQRKIKISVWNRQTYKIK